MKNPDRSATSWGRYAVYQLIRTFNCPGAMLQTCQKMLGVVEDPLLAATSGLAAGVAGKGSSCGLVSGGALGIALAYDQHMFAADTDAERTIVQLVRDYVEWFEVSYGSTRCDELSHVNFGVPIGLISYVLPGNRMLPCMKHISGSARFLHREICHRRPFATPESSRSDGNTHCARPVLQQIRSSTAVGDPVLERASIVFDGGIGLKGGACGALIAGILAVNLAMGRSLRSMSMPSAYAALLAALMQIWSTRTKQPDRALAAGNRLANDFEARYGSIECQEITGAAFTDWTAFQTHLCSSDRCRSAMDFVAAEAVRIISCEK